MSYVALATNRYDEIIEFYRDLLGFPVVDQWDRRNARGVRFDLRGMRLEILDNDRERRQLVLGAPIDRVHLVIEVDDIDEARDLLELDTPCPQTTSWGARLFQVRDPDGVPVTYLQWLRQDVCYVHEIRGEVTSGTRRGEYFTQIDWARQQFIDRLAIDPFPGTLNILLKGKGPIADWMALRSTPGIRIDNPNNGPNDCDARCYRVLIDGVLDGAIVLPEVENYPENQIEVIAPVRLRDALSKGDGDVVVLEMLKNCAAAAPGERSDAP